MTRTDIRHGHSLPAPGYNLVSLILAGTLQREPDAGVLERVDLVREPENGCRDGRGSQCL